MVVTLFLPGNPVFLLSGVSCFILLQQMLTLNHYAPVNELKFPILVGEKWVIVCHLLICVCELFNGRKMRPCLCCSPPSTVCQTSDSHCVHLTTNAMYQTPMKVTRVWPNHINHTPSQLHRFIVILTSSFDCTNVLTEIQMVSPHNSFLLSRYIYTQNQEVTESFIKVWRHAMSQETEIFRKAEQGQRVTVTALLRLIKCHETFK
jgi:hypothetical protein